jgi:AraC-like DNA-binding protein
VFLCGAYQFSGDVGQSLLNALPQVLSLPTPPEDSLRDVITVLSRELVTTAPGHHTVLDRLLDVVLVLSIRAGLRHSATAPRWYQALADPRLSAALQATHHAPAHPWTVSELAAISGLSRASLARLFRRVLGQPPLQYLTDWRMTLARDLLRDDERTTLAQLAQRTGYASPYAFAAAFRRHHGVQPRYGQKPPPVDRGMSIYCLDEVSALVVRAVVEAEHREAVPT